MISIKRNIQTLVSKAITNAFPLQEKSIIKEIVERGEIYDYDYFCDSPKEIFDKNKILYKKRNTFYGLSTYKEVGDDLKDQIPRNDIIEKIQVNQNGSIKFRVRNDYIQKHIQNYQQFGNSNKKCLICLPAIISDTQIEYDYFRAINKADTLKRILEAFGHKTELAFPFFLKHTNEASNLDGRQYYGKLFNNAFFNLNPTFLSLKETLEEAGQTQHSNEYIEKGDDGRFRGLCLGLIWKTLTNNHKFIF